MKKTLFALALAAAALTGNAFAGKLVVAATPVPHTESLNYIKPMLAKQGVDLEVKVFTDYVQPNLQVAQKNVDANFMEHKPYLDEINKSKKLNLVSVTGVHVEPFGAYSKKIKNISQLPNGATVAIPNDPSNGARALLLLQQQGLIKLKDPKNLLASARDIASNPKNLKIKELDAAMLPRVLTQVDLALINTNYALQAKLNPMKDALFIEGKQSPYVNILVARPDNKNSADMQKLAKALNSPEVKKFIQTKYKGAVVPAF